MSELGQVHFVFSVTAIASGAWVLILRKGTRWHRTLGHLYAMSMLGVIVTALSIYDLFGGFGPFHIAAVVAAVTVGGGLWAVLARRPRKTWVEAHANWMAWSYVGLLAAAVSETATRFVMPAIAARYGAMNWSWFWGLVGVATLVVVLTGRHLIVTRMPGSLAAMRRPTRVES